MEKNFVRFVEKLVELSDKEKHKKLKEDFIKVTGSKKNDHFPDKVEIDRDLGIIKTYYKYHNNEKLNGFEIDQFDQEILEDANYHFETGFYNFFQGKDENLRNIFIEEYLSNLKNGLKNVRTDRYFEKFPILIESLTWMTNRLSDLKVPEKSYGREPDFHYSQMIEWFNDLKSQKEYQKASGKPRLGLIDKAIQKKFEAETGQSPALRTIRNYRQEFGLT